MLKIGIAGYGKRMQSLIKLLTEMEDCRVVAVADPQQPEETALQKIQNPQVRWYGELEEMLKKEPLDGLFIGTRCSLHTPMALTAARYNLPLFLEKPVCINQEQLNLLQGILPQMESKTVVSFPLRSCALVKTVKEIVENGTLGTLSQVQAFNNVPYGRGYYHKWYRDERETGGLFLQKATHDLDYIRSLLSWERPLRLTAVSSKQIFKGDHPAGLKCRDCSERRSCTESDWNVKQSDPQYQPGEYCCFAKDTGNHDSGSILLEYQSGLHTVYTQNFVARKGAGNRGARLIGYKATLEFSFSSGTITVYHHLENRVDRITFPVEHGHSGGDLQLIQNFIRVIKGEASPCATLHDGMISAALCLAANKAAAEHCWVELV